MRKRRGALAVTSITILLFSVAASAAGGLYLYSVDSNRPPVTKITTIADGDVLQAGTIEIKGEALDDSAIQSVSVRVDGGSPIPVIPDSKNDFNGWSVPLDLPPGNHTIEFETIDDQGKSNSHKISVEVYDKVMKVPADEIVEATGPLGTTVEYQIPPIKKNARISDPECLPASGSLFPIGTTTVTCTISFANGNIVKDQFNITVRDSTAPVITPPPDVTVKKSDEFAFITISLGKPELKDAVDANPDVYNNAPANGFGLGITEVVWTAEDDHGNKATAVQKVRVTEVVSDNGSSDVEDSIDDEGKSTTYWGGVGGGGGGSGGSHKEKDDDKSNTGGQGGGNNDNDSGSSAQYTMVINSVDMSGNSISMPASINAVNGTNLQSGSTPLTFTGDNSDYTIIINNSNNMIFDHWENGTTNPAREITLDHDTTLTAHFTSPTPTDEDTVPPTIIATPVGGKYGTSQLVTLSANEPASIYYTTNGDNPTTLSPVYTLSISISSSTTLKFIGKDAAGNISPVFTQTYEIDTVAPTVTATPTGGVYPSTQSIILTANEPATIYYTTNGNTPTTSSPTYSSAVSISSTTTLRYFAKDTVGNISPVVTQTYTIDKTSPTVTAAPSGGTLSSPQSVTLAASEAAAIYYTTDGTTPTTSSTLYSGPISISSTTTLKYFAKDTAGNSGSVITQTYTINTADTTKPSIAITDPAANSVISTTNGNIVVTGTASDSVSGVKVVEVRVDSGSYITATPKAAGDWSAWSVTVPITAGERRLVPRATDNAGNQAWNSIYVTIAASDGGGDNTLDDFGIEKIYPTPAGGNEWYVSMEDPRSDPYFRNLQNLELTLQSDGSWQVKAENGQVRMEAWSPENEKWLNVEITMYAKMISGSNELLQLYSRGGHHTSSNECLGSAYKARFYGDGDAAWVKEVTHPAYAGNRGAVQATSEPLADRWIGLKAVIYNFVENGKTYVRMESYIDDDVTDANGNLVIANSWKLASVYEDRGGWSTSNPDFNDTCFPVNKESTQQYRQRDEILNLPGGTSTQNIAAWRSDSLTWNWKYLTVREIVPPS